MDIQRYYPSKIVSAEEAVAKLKNGSRVFVGSGCGEPQHLIHAMVANRQLQDVMIFQMLSFSFEQYLKDPDFLQRFALKLFFVTISMRQAAPLKARSITSPFTFPRFQVFSGAVKSAWMWH